MTKLTLDDLALKLCPGPHTDLGALGIIDHLTFLQLFSLFLFFSCGHATLQAALSVPWSVGRSVRRSVGP